MKFGKTGQQVQISMNSNTKSIFIQKLSKKNKTLLKPINNVLFKS